MRRNREPADVPEDEGQVWEAAVAAHRQGHTLYECAVLVGFTSGSGLGIGGKKSTRNDRFDPSGLLSAIEGIGWRLEHVNHVWMQTEHNNVLGTGAANVRGLVEGRYSFRRAA